MTWEEIVSNSYEDIYRYLCYLGCTAPEAEDLTQSVFEKFFRKNYSISDIKEAREILFKIATNMKIDLYRTIKSYKKFFTLFEKSEPLQESSMETTIELKEVIEKLGDMPLRQRQALILRNVFGFSTEDAGDLLGVTSGSIKTHLFRAGEFIRRAYE